MGRPPRRFEAYQPLVEPGPTERGHRPSRHMAQSLLGRAAALVEDPDMAGIWQLGEGVRDGWMELDELAEDEEHEWAGWSYQDMPDLLEVPHAGPHGARWALAERVQVAEQALLAASEVRHGYPTWLAEAGMEDVVDRRRLRLVPVAKDVARAFVAEHHSTLPALNEKGLMFAIGAVSGGHLAAVATAGTPTGRWTDPHRVLELTRVASDRRVKGAASALVARLLDLLPRSSRPGAVGPPLFVTYSLTSEEGTSYRALADKGLRPVAFVPGKHEGGRRRGSRASLSQLDKIRWEAGMDAGPAAWHLLGDAAAHRAATLVALVERDLVARPPAGWTAREVRAFFGRQADAIRRLAMAAA